jgi:carboxyl-terminal processing protease
MMLTLRDALRRYFPVALLLMAVAVAPLAAPPKAQAADAGLVLEALGILRERYVDPVDTVQLLNGGLAGMKSALSAAGVTVDLANIPAGTGQGQAESQFRGRFDTANSAAAGRVNTTELAYAAVRGMTGVFNDSHTGFITPDQNRERQLRQRRQAAFSGIGVVLMPREGRFYIRDVIPNTPAEAAGVTALDRIMRVDTTPTNGLQADQVAGLIRGPAGTNVQLQLGRPGRTDVVTVNVTRAPIQIPAIFQVKMLEGGVGYLHLYQFVNRTGVDFRGALERLIGQGLRGLIIDLRANSGGFLHELNATMNTLLPTGRPIYQETTRGGQPRTTRTSGVPVLPGHIPLVVLIDEASASAAELMSSALQEQGRATLVGAKTSGAVEASVLIDLSDDSALSVTVLRLASGLGKRLENVGVNPDVTLAMNVTDLDQGRDTQLQRAIQIVRQRLGLARTAAPTTR